MARASLENDWFWRIEAFHITEAGRKDMDEKEDDVSRLPLPVAIKLYRRFSARRCHSAAHLLIILESGSFDELPLLEKLHRAHLSSAFCEFHTCKYTWNTF